MASVCKQHIRQKEIHPNCTQTAHKPPVRKQPSLNVDRVLEQRGYCRQHMDGK